MADQQKESVITDEQRGNMTPDEQIEHLEGLVRSHARRASNQEREITRLYDRLEQANEECAYAWSLTPDARQREEIQKRTSWSTHQHPEGDGTVIVAECVFRGEHFHVENVIHFDGLTPRTATEAGELQDKEIQAASRRLSAGILASACKALGIRTEEQGQRVQGEPAAWMDEDGCLHATLESAKFRGRPVTPLYRHPPAPAAVPEPTVGDALDVLNATGDGSYGTDDVDLELEGLRAYHQILVNKMAAPAPAEPEPEPELTNISDKAWSLCVFLESRCNEPLPDDIEKLVREVEALTGPLFPDDPDPTDKPDPQRCPHHEKGDSNQ